MKTLKKHFAHGIYNMSPELMVPKRYTAEVLCNANHSFIQSG